MLTASLWCFEYIGQRSATFLEFLLIIFTQSVKIARSILWITRTKLSVSKWYNLLSTTKYQRCKHGWTILIEIDLIELNLGHSIAGILSNYRANFQEMSRLTLNTIDHQLPGTCLDILRPMLRIVWDISRYMGKPAPCCVPGHLCKTRKFFNFAKQEHVQFWIQSCHQLSRAILWLWKEFVNESASIMYIVYVIPISHWSLWKVGDAWCPKSKRFSPLWKCLILQALNMYDLNSWHTISNSDGCCFRSSTF